MLWLLHTLGSSLTTTRPHWTVPTSTTSTTFRTYQHLSSHRDSSLRSSIFPQEITQPLPPSTLPQAKAAHNQISLLTISGSPQNHHICDLPKAPLLSSLHFGSLNPEMAGNTRRSSHRSIKSSNNIEPVDDWKTRLALVEKHLQSVDDEIKKEQEKLDKMAAKAVKVAKLREEAEDAKFELEQQQKEDVHLTHYNNDKLDNYKAICHLDAEREDLDRQLDFLSMGLLWPKSKGRFRKMRDELRKLWDSGESGCPKYLLEKTMKKFAELNETAAEADFDLDLELGKPEVTEDELSRFWARED
ncbi:uncharacterized protein BKA78DRAFT_308334 [Phyllosticta capitalensis]|uniref:uncharacterized protein n=1 Tax=Phyllosticta capitalensis TaxID=121624 RepID=UPI0031321AC2